MIHEERPLDDDEIAELRDAAATLEIDDLDEVVRSMRAAPPDEEMLFSLGAWWGMRIRERSGWTWVYLHIAEGLEAPALVPPDRSTALLPLQVVAAVVHGEIEDCLRAILDRLSSGERPRGQPGSYALVAWPP